MAISLTDLPDSAPNRLLPDLTLVRRIMWIGSFVMFAMVTQFFVNAADSAMVGRLDAEEATAAQAALSLGMPMFWAVCGFFSAISFGTQALTARRYGEGDDVGAGQVLANAIRVAVIAGVIGSAVGWASAELSARFFAESSIEQRELATDYAQIRSLGVAGVVLAFAYKAFFDGLGRTQIHLVAALVMNVCNITLNYILIFGVESWGIPKSGLHGAAWASTISTYVGCLIMIGASLLPRYRKRFRYYRARVFSPLLCREILRLMLPSGSATLFLMTGFLLFVKFVGQLDALEGGGSSNTYAAATTALFNTAAMVVMPLFAFGSATATAVSQSLGAGKPILAARYGWEAVRVGIMAVLVVGVFFWIFAADIMAFWLPHDSAVQAAGIIPLRMIACALPFLVVGVVLSQALYGAGANNYVAKVEGILLAGVVLPLSWLLGPKLGLGLPGSWAAMLTYALLQCTAMAVKFRGQAWRSIRL